MRPLWPLAVQPISTGNRQASNAVQTRAQAMHTATRNGMTSPVGIIGNRRTTSATSCAAESRKAEPRGCGPYCGYKSERYTMEKKVSARSWSTSTRKKARRTKALVAMRNATKALQSAWNARSVDPADEVGDLSLKPSTISILNGRLYHKRCCGKDLLKSLARSLWCIF